MSVSQKEGLRLELKALCRVAHVTDNARRSRQRAGSIADEPAPRRKDGNNGKRAQGKGVEDALVHETLESEVREERNRKTSSRRD